MTLAIDTTVAGTSANSYCDVAAASAYFESNNVFYPIWLGLAALSHMTGSPTISFSSGVGTLSVAQPNIAVGDVITYDTSSVCYVSAVTSTTVVTVTDVYGLNTIADAVDKTVVSITKPDQQVARLIAAATAIDALNYRAHKYDINQRMQFPRTNQIYITEIPDRVIWAQLETVIYHYAEVDASTGLATNSRPINALDVFQTIKIDFGKDAGKEYRNNLLCGGSVERIRILLSEYLLPDAYDSGTFELTR